MKNTQFSANKSSYLRNGARQDQSYYLSLIGTRICAFNWYQNHRPWMTLNYCTFEFSHKFASIRRLLLYYDSPGGANCVITYGQPIFAYANAVACYRLRQLAFLVYSSHATYLTWGKRSICCQCKKYDLLMTDVRLMTGQWPTSHFWKISNGHNSAMGHPIHFVFDSRVGFSGMADRTVLLRVH